MEKFPGEKTFFYVLAGDIGSVKICCNIKLLYMYRPTVICFHTYTNLY